MAQGFGTGPKRPRHVPPQDQPATKGPGLCFLGQLLIQRADVPVRTAPPTWLGLREEVGASLGAAVPLASRALP